MSRTAIRELAVPRRREGSGRKSPTDGCGRAQRRLPADTTRNEIGREYKAQHRAIQDGGAQARAEHTGSLTDGTTQDTTDAAPPHTAARNHQHWHQQEGYAAAPARERGARAGLAQAAGCVARPAGHARPRVPQTHTYIYTQLHAVAGTGGPRGTRAARQRTRWKMALQALCAKLPAA